MYTPNKYDVNVGGDVADGEVKGDENKVEHGKEVYVTFTPDPGYKITGATVNGEAADFTDTSFEYRAEVTGNVDIVITTAKIPYTIIYNMDGGTVSGDNVTTYDVESDTITLINPTKAGYRFAGWTGTDLSGATMTVTIPKGSIGDRTYTATWTENEVTINYVVVGPDDAGTVTPETQTVGQVTGAPSATATVSSNAYKFVGWYSDAACTVLVSTNPILTPKKVDGLYEAATYYAKFEYNLTSLTITVANSAAVDNNQGFIFEIKTKTGADAVNVTVVVLNNGTVKIEGLTIDNTYTITLKNQWSWRYENVSREITLTPGVQNEVTVTVTRKETKWLDSNGYSIKRG